MSNSRKYQEIGNSGGLSLRRINLGKVKTCLLDQFLTLALSKDWLKVNNGEQLQFDAELKAGKLVLSASLANLSDNTNFGDTNVM